MVVRPSRGGDTMANWVERRRIFEADIPRYWDGICLELRDAVASFGKYYALQMGVEVEVNSRNGCIHIALPPLEPDKIPPDIIKSIDICLDLKRRCITAVTNTGEKIAAVELIAGAEGKTRVIGVLGENRELLMNDAVSEKLLQGFLFP